MGERFNFFDAVNVEIDQVENSASIKPGRHWNTLINIVRHDEQNLRSLGAAVSSAAGTIIHSGMCEITAEAFAHAAQPPLTAREERTFMEGAMSQVPLMQVLDRAQGGQL